MCDVATHWIRHGPCDSVVAGATFAVGPFPGGPACGSAIRSVTAQSKRLVVIGAGVLVASALCAVLVTQALVPLCFPLEAVSDVPPEPAQRVEAVGPTEPMVVSDLDSSQPDGGNSVAHAPDRRRPRRGNAQVDADVGDPAVRREGPGSYVVSREAVEATLESGGAAGASAAREWEDGRVVGYRLAGVGGSPLSRLGLRDGDVLMSVNGIPTDSADSALGAFGRLRNSDSLFVVVRRGGRRLSLRYRIE